MKSSSGQVGVFCHKRFIFISLWLRIFVAFSIETASSGSSAEETPCNSMDSCPSEISGAQDELTYEEESEELAGLKLQLLQNSLHLSKRTRLSSEATNPVSSAKATKLATGGEHFRNSSFDAFMSATPGLSSQALLLQVGSVSLLNGVYKVHRPDNLTLGREIALQPISQEDSGRIRSSAILAAYLMLYLYSVSAMAYSMTSNDRRPDKHLKGEVCSNTGRRLPTDLCVEDEIWRRSWREWLFVSWLNPLVARLGHSLDAAMTRVDPDELPQHGSRDVQAWGANERFEQLWKEEVEAVGEAKASVLRVMVRVWTVKYIFLMTAVLFWHLVFLQIYGVLLVQHSLSYYFYLQEYFAAHGVLPDMTGAVIAAIGYFSVIPISNIVLTTVEHAWQARMDQGCVGLGVALFKKTMRLPSSCLGSNAETESKAKKNAGENTKPNAMVLIQNDIVFNLHGIVFSMAMCFNSFIAIIALLVFLTMRIHSATLFSLAVALIGLVLAGGTSGGVVIAVTSLQDAIDRRGETWGEVLKGISVVKCYAWEEAMQAKISEIRKREVKLLKNYFQFCGYIVGIFNGFPRLLILSGLWAYTYLYGHHEVATIFASMQILSCLRVSCEIFGGCFTRILSVAPSIQRIERYLKQQEAPVLPGHKEPTWVDLWPQKETNKNSSVRLKGSFAWSPAKLAPTVLSNLDLNISKGQLVAVVGAVGSGKSTLLQAALGELYPTTPDANEILLSRPRTCAYCPQVPHIVEGTLRDNVLFGRPFDQKRYQQALKAASLTSDLQVLPGGDEVRIGARGVRLSGGQRARVALARAAYHDEAELALLDDPFGSVDAPTASAILDGMLLGPLMKSRTRFVVLQPEVEKLKHFDSVIIMSEGKVQLQGTPEEIFKTESFQDLQRTSARQQQDRRPEPNAREDCSPKKGAKSFDDWVSDAREGSFREGEHEGRPTWQVVKHYCAMGKWRNMFISIILYSVVLLLFLFADLSLANWTNLLAFDKSVDPEPYMWAYLYWVVSGLVVFAVAWHFGQEFSLNLAGKIHKEVMESLLRAPMDRFFDKHPIGRIMNRLTTDLSTIDMQFFAKISGSVMIVYQTLIPMIYIHTIMPWIVTVLAIPFYYVLVQFYLRYQNASVPLRYCMFSATSHSNSYLSDAMANSVVARGFGQETRLAQDYALVTDGAVRADLTDNRLLRRWLVNRITFLWSFFNTATFLVGMYNCDHIGSGTLGICIVNMLMLESMIDPNLEHMCGGLFQLISLARIHEYTNVPQEQPRRLDKDVEMRNYSVRYLRKHAPELTMKEGEDGVTVLKDGKVLLCSSKDGRALVLSKSVAEKGLGGPQFQDLCPSCEDLGRIGSTHRIIAANDAVGSAKAIAEELCKNKRSFMTAAAFSSAPQVMLDIQSSWLADGASVKVENLVVGYADIPKDVLCGVNFSIDVKTKVGIVGTTGCGKSSMLLAMLRILEPRAGRILINGVDTREVGLATLRSALGLIPQDPVLFSGTVRHNLDPFKQYTDGRVKQAVRCAHLEDLMKRLPNGLDSMISEDGTNLSFGQRQLLCLARMVLRQPSLLLLDEATSAIDPKTQELVQATIVSAFPTATLLAVAHRLETIMDFDHVLVMDKGKIAEEGPVKEVAQRPNGILKGMLAAKQHW
eukprot:TRINITY_DN6275_c0_g1_i1.p1 TRINITY_DN6275_c0_g1~~TRINITY_DN6275_c0_g1_i1.p1  ORF type:complete len:1641 (+),score=241.15 TRINITY_DN6275_c0_g1_i1:84-5006(+)